MVGDRGRVLATVTMVGLLALGGCTGGDPDPEPPGPATTDAPTTPAPTASPSTAPKPERPADLDRTDEAGAAAAARYFVALYPYVLATGDVSDWNAMSTETCDFCKGIESDAGDVRAGAVVYSGGAIALSEVDVLAKDELLGGYPIDAYFIQDPELRRDSTGATLGETSGDEGIARIDTINVRGSWQILAMVVKDA